jgi:predicted ATPase
MITKFQVSNFKALRNVSVNLTPLHVLIGPNNSGKSSILDAIYGLLRSVTMPLAEAFNTPRNGYSLLWHMEQGLVVRFHVHVDDGGASFEYGLGFKLKDSPITQEEWTALPSASNRQNFALAGANITAVCHASRGQVPVEDEQAASVVRKSLNGVQYYRWNTRLLGLPAAPDSSRRFRMHESGFGLVLCLDDILGFDRDRFAALEKAFLSIFPDVQSIQLVSEPAFRTTSQTAAIPTLTPAEGKGIHIEFKDGLRLPALQVSDGMLLVLAYLSLFKNPESPRVLLIEEPENGVHPSRLKDVISILRSLVQGQDHTQVILTTHSPYVLDLFEPNEVTLCRKAEDGSISTQRLSDSPLVERQRKVFTLGEIWTAEGDEALGGKALTQAEATQE